MTNAIQEINQDVVHPQTHNQDELLTSDVLVELPAKRLPFSYARRAGVLLGKNKDHRIVYYRGELDVEVLLEVRRIAGHGFTLEQLDDDKFELLLEASYQRDSSETQQMMEDIGNEVDLFSLADELPQTEDLLAGDDDAPIIKLINAMLSEAIKEGASDIHIETFEQELVIRFRVDGVLKEVLKPNRKLASLLVSRIKVMAKLDIAEKRIPQDGRISLRIAGRAVDVRVSTMPSSFGERVVLRLLDKNNARLNLEDLGMTAENRALFSDLISKPHGIILVTGPTGSGKSTTLYAGMSQINSRDRNILTVEDPIEYEIPGIGQTQVNAKVDMTFARGLRAILRQDPDVVMVGEIRDLETAQIGVQASLTGHLVMSTLHTNTASGAITRMEDMGVEPFLLSSSLLGVLSQRLVRTLCNTCKEGHTADEHECQLLGVPFESQPTIYRAVGCEECNFNGYRGRTGIHELLVVDETIREMIHNGKGEQSVEKYIRKRSPSIRQDGCSRVLAGKTTLEEVLRVTREEG
ncbi:MULTISPECIES: type II secretion system ATPase GspE [Pseudoalteromonas]|jgi:general secretion pathway protein E|uniref:Type II secretion system protein E n=4 Tax=root TaxID=1 RepID=A0ABT9GKI4_9GAMM|nr:MULTISPECIES: type II secretion system ATPase GspE [Pseudoalteromonas]EGI71886.1 general secretion pathway protein E [Pseudoalteromonas distincta]KAA1163750.1 type II secretion system protein GspE [Pseudoalteromonas distincta]KHM50489.1 general secretion pathway protein GspE [Pseudoalteromonas elyakovii]KID37382.1 general secretion pathway protein GspE [Pseudoalteromonas distincta]MBE3674595.1 general secretion pathway protein E [Pseudoalteromonas distincta KMM 3548]|tara:strand:+ start:8406 stop:9971 length:1566 start_codon:yes stop_codon:yes gene_type:complete